MSTWNAKAKKIVGCVAAVTVLCGSSALAYAAGAGMNASDKTKTEPAAQTTAADEAPAPQTKDETVYVLAGADGAVKKVIVSDWVKNTAGAAQITDESDVNDPQNVKSDAGYTLSQDGLRVWDAQGQDIYYQGTVDKELPVTLNVKYTLDGAAISLADLAGKSGKVTMRFDYENRQSETVTIDGKPTKIYVPFVMMTGMILDNDVFRNVTVSNGKLINDGDRSVVMGFAMPGMQENLALDKDKVDIPNYVEITADVTNFELTTTLTLATNELFNEVDTDKFASLDELTAKMDDLTDAMNRLMDGSSKLYTNLKTLTEKSRTLVSSIDQLAEGAGQLADGAKTVSDGSKTVSDGVKTVADGSAQIYTNMATLSTGLQTLTSNSADLTDGAKRVFDTLLSTANTQIKAAGLEVPELTIDSYAATLDQVIASLDEASVRALAEKTARETVTAKVNEQEEIICDKVTEGVRAKVLEKVLAKAMNGMTVEQYQQAVAAGMVDEATQAKVNGAVDQQMQTAEIQAQVQQTVEAQKAQLIEQAMAGDEVKGQIEQAVAKAAAGVQQLTALKEQLDSYNTFYQGVLAYTAGAGTAADGAQQLTAGAKQLTDGAQQLSDGSAQLSDGAAQLSSSAATLAGYLNELRDQSAALPDGAQQLTDGAMQLSDGLKELNEQGVKKLADAVNGDLNGLLTRVRATVDVSKDYDNFAGKATGTDGTVRFIYRTDSIEPAAAK